MVVVGHRGPPLLPPHSGTRLPNDHLSLPGTPAGTDAGEGANDEAAIASVLTNLELALMGRAVCARGIGVGVGVGVGVCVAGAQ